MITMFTHDDTAQELIRIARSWMGTPYIHQQATKGAGCDCIGLLRGVFKEYTGNTVPIPPYSADWAESNPEETMYNLVRTYIRQIPIIELAPGDMALFRMTPKGAAKHCGLISEVNGKTTIIHARHGRKVSEEILSPYFYKKLAFVFRM